MISDHGLFVQTAGQLVAQFRFQVARVNRNVFSLTLTDKRQALAVVEMDDESDDPLITPMSTGFVETGKPFRLSELVSCTEQEALRLFPFALV
ncbi:MAG: hypothetical protein WC457_00065 [Patescibacteria group bacterium]